MFQKYSECMLFILRLCIKFQNFFHIQKLSLTCIVDFYPPYLAFSYSFSSFAPFFTCSHLFVHLCEETQQSPLCIQLWSLYFRILCLISKGSSRHIGHIIVFIRVLKDTNLHSHSRHICQFTYIPKQVQIYLNVYKSDVYVYHCS